MGTGHPDQGTAGQGSPALQGASPTYLGGDWASCFEAVACLLSEEKSFPSPYPAPTILPPPPIMMLLLLIVKHSAGFPAARRCT